MAVDLTGSRAKVERARQHYQALEADFVAWVAEQPEPQQVQVARYWEPDTGMLRFVVGSAPDAPPNRWGVFLGDIVHNLRSALDHLAYALADDFRPNRGRDATTQFPICSSPKKFAESGSRLQHVGPMHRAMIEDAQPYQPPNTYSDHPLWLLHELSNTDKHRLIHVVFFASDLHSLLYQGAGYQFVNADFEQMSQQTIHEEPLIPGTTLMTVRLKKKDPTGPDPDMELILPQGIGLNLALGPGQMLKHIVPNLIGATDRVLDDFDRG